MKKWTGGTLILILTLTLFLRYSLPPSLPLPKIKTLVPSSPPLPGLSELITPNFTHHLTPNPNLIWPHILPVLSRPDALPATADAVKEASIAWRDLMASVRAGKDADLSPEKGKACPFSVSGDGSGVEIPCGLVQDSAVTVVGVPVARNGSSRFGFELVGGGNGVVVRVNVSIEGDGVVIGQSSKRAESGWGEWEMCPVHGVSASSSILKVDGLIRCNEQLGKGVIQENLNGSSTDNKKPMESSKRGSILSSNSPFVEGHPFATTLWAGIEGFHMTVNGRHTTSYFYRDRLEPWLVNKIRVEGDLDLMSILVTGLPASEDLDLNGDVQSLKAPLLPKKRLLMLVGISSAANNFDRRMALRRSWMQYEAVRSGDVAVRFLTGLHKNKQVNLELWKEAQIYGDIQLMPFVDYYSLITLKTVAVCILGTKVIPAKYIMKTDDDAFVRIDEVLSSLKKSAPKGLLYGLIAFESSPDRDNNSKWFVSQEVAILLKKSNFKVMNFFQLNMTMNYLYYFDTKEWPHDMYPPWAHGPGYIISRDIAKFIVQGHRERNLKLFKLEDVAMGIWIQEYKKSGQEVNYVNDDRFNNVGCESDYVLAHYQGPRLLLCLWEKLQREQEPSCCE